MIRTLHRTRRAALVALAASALGLTGTSILASEAWPTKPIKVLVPYVAGGPVDSVTRMLRK